MNVKLGWSGDIHGTWTKMDVEVDEVDLRLHFIDSGATDVDNLKYSPIEKYKLMYALAELFVKLHKMSRFPEFFAGPEDKKELEELIKSRNSLTRTILERAPF